MSIERLPPEISTEVQENGNVLFRARIRYVRRSPLIQENAWYEEQCRIANKQPLETAFEFQRQHMTLWCQGQPTDVAEQSRSAPCATTPAPANEKPSD